MKAKKSKAPASKRMPVWVWGLIAAAVIFVLGLLVFRSMQPATVVYPAEISVAQAAEKRDQGAFILDVRQPEEWTQLHIPGAVLIPLGELKNRLSEVPQDKEVVVVCRSGNRSAQARDFLRSAGYTTVTSMAGGMNQWQSASLPTATGQ